MNPRIRTALLIASVVAFLLAAVSAQQWDGSVWLETFTWGWLGGAALAASGL